MVAFMGAAGTDLPEAGKLQDRRCCRRARILTGMLPEVVVLRLGSQTGLAIDLCTHGIGVQAVHPLASAGGFDTSFRLPFTGEIIEAQCDVAWNDDRNRAGVKFVRVAESTKQRLQVWLAAHIDELSSPAAVGLPETLTMDYSRKSSQ